MWIRSQDKTHLVKCDNIIIEEKTELKIDSKGAVVDFPYVKEVGTGEWLVQNYVYTLGKYSSKEKALKVLDLIEKHMNKKNAYDILDTENISKPYKITQSCNMVLQMPQDEEVE